jgi:hypothetical protein
MRMSRVSFAMDDVNGLRVIPIQSLTKGVFMKLLRCSMVIAGVLTAMLGQFSYGASASCENLRFTAAPRQSVDSRVEESGFFVTFKLSVSGCQDQKVPVQLYAVDAAGRETFLDEEFDTPRNRDTTWNVFRMYVPLSRFAYSEPTVKWHVYIKSPTDSRAFIGDDVFRQNPPYRPSFVLRWNEWKDEVDIADGKHAFQISFRLSEDAYNTKGRKAVIILEDSSGNTLKAVDGSSLVTNGATLTCSQCNAGEYVHWDNVAVNVPYEMLKEFDPGTIIYARPGLRFDSGETDGGNLYIKFLAGGSTDTVYQRFQDDSKALTDAVNNIDSKIHALEGR